MVTYTCDRCGYSTPQKTHFINHLNRKNICKVINLDVNITTIKEKYGIICKEEKMLQNCSVFGAGGSGGCINSNYKNTPIKKSSIDESKPKPSCEYCGNVFSKKSNLTRHYTRCKVKINL